MTAPTCRTCRALLVANGAVMFCKSPACDRRNVAEWSATMADPSPTHLDRAEAILDALRAWWGLPPRHPADDDHSELRMIRAHLDAVRAEGEQLAALTRGTP